VIQIVSSFLLHHSMSASVTPWRQVV